MLFRLFILRAQSIHHTTNLLHGSHCYHSLGCVPVFVLASSVCICRCCCRFYGKSVVCHCKIYFVILSIRAVRYDACVSTITITNDNDSDKYFTISIGAKLKKDFHRLVFRANGSLSLSLCASLSFISLIFGVFVCALAPHDFLWIFDWLPEMDLNLMIYVLYIENQKIRENTRLTNIIALINLILSLTLCLKDFLHLTFFVSFYFLSFFFHTKIFHHIWVFFFTILFTITKEKKHKNEKNLMSRRQSSYVRGCKQLTQFNLINWFLYICIKLCRILKLSHRLRLLDYAFLEVMNADARKKTEYMMFSSFVFDS